VLAGIVLVLGALAALSYGVLLLLNQSGVFAVLFELPVPILLYFLLSFAGMMLAIVQLIAGIMLFARRGRGLAIVVTLLALLAWGAVLVLLFTETGAQSLDYLLVGLAAVLNLVGFIVLLSARGAFAARRY
jgi:hypothetical protein